MPVINDLSGFGRGFCGCLSVRRRTVPADDFDTRMIVEPLLYGFGIAVRQEINDIAPLQIHDNRSVPLPSDPGPVIDPNKTGRRRRFLVEPPDASEQRVWAGGHGEDTGEAGVGFTAESQPNRTADSAEAVSRMGIRLHKPREALGKDAARALGLWAKERSDRDF